MAVSNTDYSDRELLLVITRVMDEEGVSSATDIADAIGLAATDQQSAAGRLAPRLSWMAHFGFVERVDPKALSRPPRPSLWRPTSMGETLLRGKLAKPVEAALGSAEPGTSLLAMRVLVRRGYVDASPKAATALRREYLHNAARRLK